MSENKKVKKANKRLVMQRRVALAVAMEAAKGSSPDTGMEAMKAEKAGKPPPKPSAREASADRAVAELESELAACRASLRKAETELASTRDRDVERSLHISRLTAEQQRKEEGLRAQQLAAEAAHRRQTQVSAPCLSKNKPRSQVVVVAAGSDKSLALASCR